MSFARSNYRIDIINRLWTFIYLYLVMKNKHKIERKISNNHKIDIKMHRMYIHNEQRYKNKLKLE